MPYAEASSHVRVRRLRMEEKERTMSEQTYRLGVQFPGQGSQEKGMGRDVAEAFKDAMELWKKAESISGYALREIYWEGDDAAMARTEHLQPALTVVNTSLWMRLAEKLGTSVPTCLAGHSLGEFSALAAAEVLHLDKVLELVSLRGKLMAEADPQGTGKMAAVLKMDKDVVQDLVRQVAEQTGELCLIANYNSPAQYVVSGTAGAVDTLAPLVKEGKGRMIVLPVSGAFHSPMMAEAAAELKKCMAAADWSKPRRTIFFNVTAQAESDPQAIQEIMTRQMTSSVLWTPLVRSQWDQGVRTWWECGPKNVLTKLLKANLADKDEAWQALSLNALEAVEGAELA